MTNYKFNEDTAIAVHDIARRLRTFVKEYGEILENAVIISPYDFGNSIIGFKHIRCVTISKPMLGNIDNYKACRLFEDS